MHGPCSSFSWLVRGAVFVIAAGVVTGCGAPRQTKFMEQADHVDMSTRELSVRVYEFATEFSGDVEVAANRIISESPEGEIQRQALIWKVNAATVIQRSAFRHDPLVAFLDCWIFTLQMQEFFETGPGQDLFREWQPYAVSVCDGLVESVEALASVVVNDGDLTRGREFCEKWAQEHPLTSEEFVRASLTNAFPQFVDSSSPGGIAAMQSMDMAMTDLSDRLTMITEQLTKQIAWKSELVVDRMLERDDVRAFLADVGTIDGAIDTIEDSIEVIEMDFDAIAQLIAESPQLLAVEREIMFGQLAEERQIILDSIDLQRQETLLFLDKQRELLLTAFEIEREATFAQIEALGQNTLSGDGMKGFIDHVFYRVLQLLAIVLVALGFAAFLAYRAWVHRSALR